MVYSNTNESDEINMKKSNSERTTLSNIVKKAIEAEKHRQIQAVISKALHEHKSEIVKVVKEIIESPEFKKNLRAAAKHDIISYLGEEDFIAILPRAEYNAVMLKAARSVVK
jgi:hypothetical protein